MKEILFRGKRKENGKWIYGSLVPKETNSYADGFLIIDGALNYDELDDYQPSFSTYDVVPSTVGQYTGLTDKNGNKIFEGDIVKQHFGKEKGIVKFGEYRQPFNDDIHTKHIGFYVDWISGEDKELLRKDLGYWVILDKDFGYEIFIGENIYDNPELLKEAEQE